MMGLLIILRELFVSEVYVSCIKFYVCLFISIEVEYVIYENVWNIYF